jgi:hypothetical protein
VTLVFSRETVMESPRFPALPPATLMRSCRNFSSEAMSMILSSTGLVQSITNVTDPFFFPPAAPPPLVAVAAPRAISLLFLGWCSSEQSVWRLGFQERREGSGAVWGLIYKPRGLFNSCMVSYFGWARPLTENIWACLRVSPFLLRPFHFLMQ